MRLRIVVVTLTTILFFAAAQTPKPASSGLVKIAGGSGHNLALFADGTVIGWRDMRSGALGPKSGIPNNNGQATAYVRIPLPSKVVDIAAGSRTSYFLLESGAILAMGDGRNGELGCGERCLAGSEEPVPVAGIQDAVRIAAGSYTAFAVHRDGTVSGWGSPANGLLGERASNDAVLTPVPIPGLRDIADISATGQTHVLGLTKAGKVWHWGKFPMGIVFADDPVLAPHEVPGLSGAKTVVSTWVAAALKNDGTVWVWGNNGQALFGNGRREQTEKSPVPVRVAGVANVAELAGANGGRHFLALLRDGTIRTWGNNDFGQAGNGAFGTFQMAPATSKISGVKAVFAVGNNSYAVRNDGSIWFWGGGGGYEGVWPLGRKGAPLPIPFPFP